MAQFEFTTRYSTEISGGGRLIFQVVLIAVGTWQAFGVEPTYTRGDLADAAENSSKLPLPSPEAQRIAAAKLREVFRKEFAEAKTPDKKLSLATILVNQTNNTASPSERWAMLSEALRLCIEAGDVATGVALLDRIPSEFAVRDENEARLDGLTKLTARATDAEADTLGREILQFAGNCNQSDSPALASKAILTVIGLARKTKNASLLAAATSLQSELKAQQKAARAETVVLEKLQKNPDNPDVCLEAGKFFSFKANRWDKGLPLLARGSNAAMAQAATTELAATAEDGRIARLADRWWEIGESENGSVKAALQSHAADLYRRGLDSLAGLDKVRAEKRIAEAAAGSRQAGTSPIKRIPGLVLWLDASDLAGFEPQIQRNGDDARISLWRDASGRGNDAKQPDSAKQPVWSSKGFAGHPGVTFSAAQALQVPMPCGNAGTVIVTLRPRGVGNMRFLGCYRNNSEHVGLCLRSDGSVWAEALTPGNAAAVAKSQPSAYKGEQNLLLGQTWGRSVALVGAKATPAVFAPSDQALQGPWGIGGAYLAQPVEYFQGAIGEVIVFDRELNAQELEVVAVELASKWHCR